MQRDSETGYGVMLLPFVLCLLIFTSSAFAVEVVGKVQLVGGESWLLKGGQSKIDLKRGMFIEARDTVVTGERGRVKLMMLDGSTLFVSKNSRLEAKRYALTKGKKIDEAKLDLFWGKVRFQVKHLTKGQGSFQMRTTTAVMGIRGTSGIFSSAMLPSDHKVRLQSRALQSIPKRPSQLVLTSGLVSMKSLVSGKMSLVQAGQTAMISARGALKVRPSRHRDLYIPPTPSVDENKSVSPQKSQTAPPAAMPPPPADPDPQGRATSRAKQTLKQQSGTVIQQQKVSTAVKKLGSGMVQQSQTQAQVQVQQKINSITSVQIVPKVIGP